MTEPATITPGVVLTTTSAREEAEQIAQTLITENLAACVNLVPIQSIYRWEGEICNGTEIQLIIKTDLNRFEQIQARIRAIHSYELPEIIAFPITQGSASYLRWIAAQVHI